jgi:hybrid polyketide synthase/nonribosomal peptide synthetase FtdB
MKTFAHDSHEKIAIIGMGCRFPGGANDYQAFWRNLIEGKDCLVDTPLNRFNAPFLYSKDKAKRGKLTGGRGGYIDGFDEFDPSFFGITLREAEYMDPQQRKLLEVSWEALEDAGLRPFTLAGQNIGVFIGAFTLDYKIVQFADLTFSHLAAHTATGTMMTMVSNRLSYFFDFNGPSMSIDTACSSSLVAVHLACESIKRGESSMALAGGVLLQMTPQYTIAESKGGFLSPEGLSRTFDKDANGYVRSEGVGIVVLKRLRDALKDNDTIHGVIIGSGVNQDGKSNGITSPRKEAQVRLIREVCHKAAIQPKDLQYIEAHGTSTPVGDPIEAHALGEILAEGRTNEPCYIGSVKTNIGHTESAAGVAGLIKTVLALKHKTIPPHINLKEISPALEIHKQPYQIPTIATPWPEHEGPARAGVNSFGFGGTNAHVILEEASLVSNNIINTNYNNYIFLPISAHDPELIKKIIINIKELIINNNDENYLRNIAYTYACKRQKLNYNSSFVFKNKEELLELFNYYLNNNSHAQIISHNTNKHDEALIWVFTGMGPQWWGMGQELFLKEPIFRKVIEACDQEIAKHSSWSLIKEMNAQKEKSNMAETWLAQPANFALQIALAALWRSWGVNPAAIVGHSTGEAAAFYEAGVYSLADAITIIINRSRLQQKLAGSGTMLALSMSEKEAYDLIKPYGSIDIAALNSPRSVTLSGDQDALKELALKLEAEGIFAKFLNVKVPYHSSFMESIKDELLYALKDIKPLKAHTPLYMTAHNGKAEGPELNNNYWWDNVRNPVRFNDAINNINQDHYSLFLEIGPHPVLAHSIKEVFDSKEREAKLICSLRREENEELRMALARASLYSTGYALNAESLFVGAKQIFVPPYPWKKDCYWVEAQSVQKIRLGEVDHPLLGRRLLSNNPSWHLDLDIEKLSFIGDHRIQNNIVFPAAGYIEMANQAIKALTGLSSAHIEELAIKKALFISEHESKNIYFDFNNNNSSFSIYSLSDDGDSSLHASGFLRLSQVKNYKNNKLIYDNNHIKLSGESCYTKLAKMGYEYGFYFQSIEDASITKNKVLTRIKLKDELCEHNYHAHPALVDACLQTLLLSEIGEEAELKNTQIKLPLQINLINCERLDNSLWVLAKITKRSDDGIYGDIELFNDNKECVGVIEGFYAGALDKVRTSVSEATLNSWLHEIQWHKRALDSSQISPSSCLIIADNNGCAEALGELLKSNNYIYKIIKNYGDEDFSNYNNIIYLKSLDIPKNLCAENLDALEEYNSYALVALAQKLAQEKSCPRLIVATRNAQQILKTDCIQPLATTLWGVGRVLWQQELSQCRGKLVDLGSLNKEEDALALFKELGDISDEEVALRNNERFVSRLVEINDLPKSLPLRICNKGAYVISGAFGAIGKVVAKALIKAGAIKLILMGRTSFPERSLWCDIKSDSALYDHIKYIEELENLGAHITLASLDSTNYINLNNWYSNFKNTNTPIKGVFHCAGQVKDVLLSDMSSADFKHAYDAKVFGSYNFHMLFKDEPLEHFVLFSSVASVLTTAGQSNYAAGNAFMDALAHHRRSLGLAAQSINWGPWAVGMIETLGLVDHYRNTRGMSSLSPEAGIDVLARLLGHDKAQVIVATIIDWPLFLRWYSYIPGLLKDISEKKTIKLSEEFNDFKTRFKKCPLQHQEKLISDTLLDIAATVLRMPRDAMSEEQSLSDVGLDSLLAIELRAKIMREFNVAIPVVSLLNGTSLYNLALLIHKDISISSTQVNYLEYKNISNKKEYPLSKNQSALWFLKHLNPDGFAYNIGGAVEIEAELDPEIIPEALKIIIKRHDLLRANCIQKDGEAVHIIHDEIKIDYAFIDAQSLSFNDVYNNIIKEYRKPYDLEKDSLMRFRLYKLDQKKFIMMKAVHHIISDAVSTFTFIEELLYIYDALKTDKPIELPELKASYLDFLNWQNRLLQGPDAKRMEEYWLKALPEEIPHLSIATDKPRPQVQSHNGASCFFTFDQELSANIHILAKSQGTTVFMVLLAAYYALLQRYSNEDNIIVGSPVLGRTEEEFSSVYGYFVNPLPLYMNLSHNPSTYELLEQVKDVVLNGLDNQEYPFVLLVDKLGLKHDPSRSAVFQAMFILLVHKVATTKYGFRLKYIELPEEEGQFDLTLSAYEDDADGRFHCVFKYNSDLFFDKTIERMAQNYIYLIKNMIKEPHKAIKNLDIISHEEEKYIISLSGQEHKEEPRESIIEKISSAALKNPSQPAVIMPHGPHEDERLSYAELMKKSDIIASNVKKYGIHEGDIVALIMPKSVALITAIMGVWKAKAAFLPIDPEMPKERIKYMLDHAQAKLIIDNNNYKNISDTSSNISYDLSFPQLSSLAYVIYTSGSTGQPKAVAISHKNLSATLRAWEHSYALNRECETHAQCAHMAFDVFVGDLARALAFGHTLLLCGRDELLHSARLYEAMTKYGVSVCEMVPALARGLIKYCADNKARLDFLRLLIIGSDILKAHEMIELKNLCSNRVLNSYGLSEATIDSCYFEGDVDKQSAMTPIGRPLMNNELWVLDHNEKLCPLGVIGELYVGGLSVSQGYFNDLKRSEERFKKLNIAGQERFVYRSGDSASWRHDGQLQLWGRKDSQIKIAGHRIEIGDVEAALKSIAGIDDALVVAHHDELRAYYISSNEDINNIYIRKLLSNKLPTYMIPHVYISLENIPLSANGKVDLLALPQPNYEAEDNLLQNPETLFEIKMAEHWSRILGIDAIKREHDFFERGGTSIKLIELVYNLEQEFNITITVSSLFAMSTLGGMAKTIEDIIVGRSTGAKNYLIFNKEASKNIFCFPPAGGHGLVYRRLAESLKEYKIIAFNYIEGDDKIKRYAELIQELDTSNNYTILGYSLGGNLGFLVSEYLEKKNNNINNLIIMDSFRILERFELTKDHLEEFSQELAEHFYKHTGSRLLAEETLRQAKDYLHFSSEIINDGTLKALVSVICDSKKHDDHGAGKAGSWHGSSYHAIKVLCGFGDHADMLDDNHASLNAALIKNIMSGN